MRPRELSSVLAPFNRYGLVYTALASKVTKVLARSWAKFVYSGLTLGRRSEKSVPRSRVPSFLPSHHTKPSNQQPTHQLPAQAWSNAIVRRVDAMTDKAVML